MMVMMMMMTMTMMMMVMVMVIADDGDDDHDQNRRIAQPWPRVKPNALPAVRALHFGGFVQRSRDGLQACQPDHHMKTDTLPDRHNDNGP